MPKSTLTIPAQAALREMHPDPFVQAAVWRLYTEAPGLLSEATAITLTNAITKGA